MNNIILTRALNSSLVVVLMGVLSAAYYQQYVREISPCPLCILQRLAMIGTGLGALMNLRFGIKNEHYAISLLNIFFGSIVSLRHIALHVCSFSTFSGSVVVFGLNLYTWAFIVFYSSFLAIIALLFMKIPKSQSVSRLNFLERSSFFFMALLILANLVTILGETDFGFYYNLP